MEINENINEINKETIFSLLKSIELHIVKLENRILHLENKIDNINRPKLTFPYSPPMPPFGPEFPSKPPNPFC
tara:strand:+ start:133 stop:351 length:219 start_codon:yes stop_codon:yes gene_type:complete